MYSDPSIVHDISSMPCGDLFRNIARSVNGTCNFSLHESSELEYIKLYACTKLQICPDVILAPDQHALFTRRNLLLELCGILHAKVSGYVSMQLVQVWQPARFSFLELICACDMYCTCIPLLLHVYSIQSNESYCTI